MRWQLKFTNLQGNPLPFTNDHRIIRVLKIPLPLCEIATYFSSTTQIHLEAFKSLALL